MCKVNRKGQAVEYCFKVISILIIIIIILLRISTHSCTEFGLLILPDKLVFGPIISTELW